MNIFKGQNLLEFSDWFKTDKDCKGYLQILNGKMVFNVLNVGI